ncbi:hypothetical protein M8J77_002974 [Diaphorina citri]|nr:hypothetical protein M8J77_002974 [Diaphorina citri]
MQEPYNQLFRNSSSTKIPGFGNRTKVTHMNTTDRVFAAIAIFNNELKVMVMDSLCTEFFAVILLHLENEDIYIISGYFKPNIDIDTHCNQLKEILDKLSGKKIVIGADFNARSIVWYDRITNNEGRIIENFLIEQNLYLINLPSENTTFCNTALRKSNIDLTLVSGNMMGRLTNWSIREDLVISSDHNLLEYSIHVSSEHPETRKKNFNVGAANWNSFKSHIESEYEKIEWNGLDAEELAVILTNTIRTAAEKSIPYTKEGVKRTRWWNQKLHQKKKKVRKARRLYQRCSDTNRNERYEIFSRERAEYCKLIKESKRKSFQKFVESDLQNDPWGNAQKLIRSKLRISEAKRQIKKPDGSPCISIKEATDVLLNVMIPTDSRDHYEFMEIKDEIFNENDEEEEETLQIDNDEIGEAILNIKTNKAPGPDGLNGKIIQEAFKTKPEMFQITYRKCWNERLFPKIWKQGLLKLLVKPGKSDMSNPNSYRPLTLLDVMGKILEKIILNKLFLHIQNPFSARQYGFIKGKDTVGAIQKLINTVKDREEKYAVAIYIDIASAFSNVSWKYALQQMIKKSIPMQILKILVSYFEERTIFYEDSSRNLSRGCPQGSLNGPVIWNFVIDSLLERRYPANVETIAYADDIVIIIKGNTIRELEIAIEECTNILENWMLESKQEIATNKTKIMVFGKLKVKPKIKINGRNIEKTKTFKYLGVVVDDKLSFCEHIKYISEKSKSIFFVMRNYLKLNWNTGKSLSTIYKAVILPIMSYACSVWCHRLEIQNHRRILASAQRICLLGVIKGYKTISHEATHIIAFEPPIYYIIKEYACLENFRKQGSCQYFDLSFNNMEHNKKEIKETIREKTLDLWNSKWIESQKGNCTRDIFPTVQERAKFDFVHNRDMTSILSGHGEFNIHLFRINKIRSSDCHLCSTPDTPAHRIMSCPKYEEERRRIGDKIGNFQSSQECFRKAYENKNIYELAIFGMVKN